MTVPTNTVNAQQLRASTNESLIKPLAFGNRTGTGTGFVTVTYNNQTFTSNTFNWTIQNSPTSQTPTNTTNNTNNTNPTSASSNNVANNTTTNSTPVADSTLVRSGSSFNFNLTQMITVAALAYFGIYLFVHRLIIKVHEEK